MLDADYPLVSPESNEVIIPTKPKYRNVSNLSPIFVIDCEMCFTTANRLELTRITMVMQKFPSVKLMLIFRLTKIIPF